MKLIQQIYWHLASRCLIDADTTRKLRATGLLGPTETEWEGFEGEAESERLVHCSEVRAEENALAKLDDAVEAALAGARAESGGRGKGGSRQRRGAMVNEDWLAGQIRDAWEGASESLQPLVWVAGLRPPRGEWLEAARLIADREPRELAHRLALGFSRRRFGLDVAWQAFGYRPAFLDRIQPGTTGPALTGWRLILDGADLKGLGKHGWVLGTPEIAAVYHLVQAQRRLRRACGWLYADHSAALAEAFRRAEDDFTKGAFLLYHNARRWAKQAMASRREVAGFGIAKQGRGAYLVTDATGWWGPAAQRDLDTIYALNAASFMGDGVAQFYLRAFATATLTCPIEWIRK